MNLSRRSTFALALLLVGCSGAPPAPPSEPVEAGTDPMWRRGVFPPPAWIKADAERPATDAEREAFAAKVLAVCPPGSDADPLPGLSPPARSIKPSRHRAYRSRPLIKEEIKGLLRLLGGVSRSDPDRPKILERLASNYFVDERDVYRDCLELLAMVKTDRWSLTKLEGTLRETREHLESARANGLQCCARLEAEHPTYKSRELCAALHEDAGAAQPSKPASGAAEP